VQRVLQLRREVGVGQVARLPVGHSDVCTCRSWRAPGRVVVGAGARLSLERVGVCTRRSWRAPKEHDCPWNESTCAHAARGGHLDVLVWARAHGCPWDRSTGDAADNASWNRAPKAAEVLEYVWVNGCPHFILYDSDSDYFGSDSDRSD
jgi:hypothetical protein